MTIDRKKWREDIAQMSDEELMKELRLPVIGDESSEWQRECYAAIVARGRDVERDQDGKLVWKSSVDHR